MRALARSAPDSVHDWESDTLRFAAGRHVSILIVTDAWHPQVNGVVRTLERLATELRGRGHGVALLTPERFASIPMPTYPDIRLACPWPGEVGRLIREARPTHVHIATEGPLGVIARRYCLRHGLRFTTSYHTRFPEYLRARLPVPEAVSYAWLRSFHNAAGATLVATPSLSEDLRSRGFKTIRPWTRGVDTQAFSPVRRRDLGLARPIFLSVGRISVEKNLPTFLDLDLPGSKIVVGDGPELEALRARYPGAVFAGKRIGEDLARLYASCDVFVFPSRTDTFGIVLLEALASGLPVAAYPVTGPLDIFSDGLGGIVDDDLGAACRAALRIEPAAARLKASHYSWDACTDLFLRETGIGPAGT